jgi:hypothetical protein
VQGGFWADVIKIATVFLIFDKKIINKIKK